MLLLLWLHLMSTSVLIGCGLAGALFTLLAHRSARPALIAHTAGIVNASELMLTGSAIVVQPVTGMLLAFGMGWPLTAGWLSLSIAVYLLVVLTWFLALRAQTRMWLATRDLTPAAAAPPPVYERAYRRWAVCYAFTLAGLLVVMWLMAAKRPLATLTDLLP